MAIHHIIEILFQVFIPDDYYYENIINYSNEREYGLEDDDENELEPFEKVEQIDIIIELEF